MTKKKLENDVPVTLEEIHVDVILLDWRKDTGQKSVESFLKAREFRSRIAQLSCLELPWRRMNEEEMAEIRRARPFMYCFGTMDLAPRVHDMVGLRLFVCGTLGKASGLGFVRDMEHGAGWASTPNRFMEDSWRTAGMVEAEIEKNFPELDFGIELGIWLGTNGNLIRLDPVVFRSLEGKQGE